VRTPPNRLTQVEEETSSGTVIYDEKYTYDVNGNRIGVSDNGTQELYTVYLGSNPYIDFNGSGTLTERYLFNPQSLSVFYGQVSGSGTTEWFLTDNIGSIHQVVSTTGSVLDAITYDPNGNILNQTSTTYEPRFLYAGGAYDTNTGIYQFGVRPYSPGDGRFETQDPSGFMAGDTNLYRYVSNDPTTGTDPTGLFDSISATALRNPGLYAQLANDLQMAAPPLLQGATVVAGGGAAYAYQQLQKQWIREGPNRVAMSVEGTENTSGRSGHPKKGTEGHRQGKSKSTRDKHQEGQRRRNKPEKGDARRKYQRGIILPLPGNRSRPENQMHSEQSDSGIVEIMWFFEAF
jgi:RHS repeat-associated protein